MARRRRIVPLHPCALFPFLLAVALSSTAAPGTAPASGGTKPITASIGGEVRRPGNYTLPPGATLSALLSAAGGFTDNAFLGGAILRRASAREAQQTELREAVDRSSGEVDGDGETQGAARQVVRHLSSLAPSGRIPVRLTHPRLLKGSPEELPLEQGDALFVPTKVDTVVVAGGLVAESVNILLESAPSHINISSVAAEIAAVNGVREAYHVHVWTITSGVYALSAHVVIDDMPVSSSRQLLQEIQKRLADRFKILHSTIQFECERCVENGVCPLPGDVKNSR